MLGKNSRTCANSHRILHFLADGRVGGPQVRILRVHQAMNDRIGYPVETIVACPPVQPADHFARPEMSHRVMEWHKPNAARPLKSGLGWLFSGLWKDIPSCRKIMQEFPDAIVHVNGAILLAAALAAILEKRVWVWHLNDTSVPRLLAVIVRVLLAAGGGKAIAASRAVVSYYRLDESTEVVYPPVDMVNIRDRTHLGCNPIRLGVMANLSPGKGVGHVIEAFAAAHVKNANLHLSIAGRVLENKRWYFESLQQQVRELGIENKVEFNGFVPTPLKWMMNLDLFLFSSHAEAAPVALIEALACGLPIISGEIAPSREILGGCGVLTPLGDARAMSEAILYLVEKNEIRLAHAQQAAERARAVFSVDAIARQYCQVYSGLVKGQS